MERIRQGNSIDFYYRLFKDYNGTKIPESFSGKNPVIEFKNKVSSKTLQFSMTITGNEIHAVIPASPELPTGIYIFKLTYTSDGRQVVVDCDAFEIVDRSKKTGNIVNIEGKLDVEEVNLVGIMDVSGFILMPSIGENGNWWIDGTDTGMPSRGPEGKPGKQGNPGKDAHEIEIRKTDEAIEWRRTNETAWHPIVRLSELELHFNELSSDDINRLWRELPEDVLDVFTAPSKKAAEDLLSKYEEFLSKSEKSLSDFEDRVIAIKDELIAYFRELAEKVNNAIANLNKSIASTAKGEIERTKAEASRSQNEAERIENEKKRSQDEEKRVSEELKRITAENNRSSAEQLRIAAEIERAKAEAARKSSENERINAEKDRSIAEKTRRDDEVNRIKNEEIRQKGTHEGLKNIEQAVWFAKSAMDNPGYIGEDYHVYIWSVQRQEYVKTERILRPDGFEVEAIYHSTVEMQADFYNLKEGDFVSVVTGGQAKIYMRAFDSFVPINTNYGLTKEKVEEVLRGDITSHSHDTQLQEALSSYQKTEEGKGRSTNDYTAEDKRKVSEMESTILSLINQYADVITYTTEEEYEALDEWDPKKFYVTTRGSYLQSIYIGRFLIATRGDQPAPEGFPYSLPIIF